MWLIGNVPLKIKDAFSELPISKQRKYQLRHQKKGLCIKCNGKAAIKGLCLRHAVYARERQRKQVGCVKRNHSLTYRMEEKARKGMETELWEQNENG